jgi:hypothetical protein
MFLIGGKRVSREDAKGLLGSGDGGSDEENVWGGCGTWVRCEALLV